MLTDHFQLSIPTHISFTLYKYDYFDSLIISRVLKECKNYSKKNKKNYKIKKNDFIKAITSSPRLNKEINFNEQDSGFKPNSIYFLFNIINRLSNLSWVSFKISYDKNYNRLIKYKNKEFLNFYYKIKEGSINLNEILDRDDLDDFNKNLINFKVLNNNYLDRLSYFYIKAPDFIDLLTVGAANTKCNAFNIILRSMDSKLDEDDSLLLIKTDYSIY